MLTLVSIVTLLAFVLLRPHELIGGLESIPVLNLLFVFAFGTVMIDSRARPRWSGQMGAALLLFVWSLLAVILVGDPEIVGSLMALAVPVLLLVLISGAAATFSRLATAATTIVLCSALLAFVGAHQSRAPKGCVELNLGAGADRSVQSFDGRSCETRVSCYQSSDKPEADYRCEHIGLLGTTSFRGRARYRGVINDPNEFAMAIVCALPLLLALVRIRATRRWKLAAPVIVATTMVAVLATQSRSGLLALMSMFAVVLVYRYRGWGVLLVVVAGVAGLMLGGRDSGGAQSSVYDRYEAWSVAINLVRRSPVFGVGYDNFTDYHYLTTHNSFLLIAAESGLVGATMFASLIYISFKIPLAALWRLAPGPETTVARTWALALVASLVAMMASMMFLSLSYHQVLWTYLGLSGALYGAIRAVEPGFVVRLSIRDIGVVIGLVLVLLGAFAVLLRVKGY